MPALEDLRSTVPAVATAEPVGNAEDSYGGTRDAAAAAGSAARATSVGAESSGYNAQTGEIDPANTVEGRLSSILAQDSAYMKRARQIGLREAGRRGLINSSIAAGAAAGAMTDRALPVAQQDAAMGFEQSTINQAAVNRAREFTSGAENTASNLNAQLGTQVELDNAGRDTQVDLFNTESENRAQLARLDREQQNNQFNAAQTNQMRADVLRANAELNRQFLAGNQAIDLASIQGQYQQLISSNETAARLYDSYFNSIAQAMGNADITPQRVAQYVNVQQTMLEAGLRMIDTINGLDLGDFQLPGAAGSAPSYGSTEGTIRPTPGSGEAVTGAPTPAPTTGPPPFSLPGVYPNVPGQFFGAPPPSVAGVGAATNYLSTLRAGAYA
jgi:hypothetical protein